MKMETPGVVSQLAHPLGLWHDDSADTDDAKNEYITCRIWFYMFGFFIAEMMMTSMMLPLWLVLTLMKKVPELWPPTLTWLDPRCSPVKMNPSLLLYLSINAYLKRVRSTSFPSGSVSFRVMRF